MGLSCWRHVVDKVMTRLPTSASQILEHSATSPANMSEAEKEEWRGKDGAHVGMLSELRSWLDQAVRDAAATAEKQIRSPSQFSTEACRSTLLTQRPSPAKVKPGAIRCVVHFARCARIPLHQQRLSCKCWAKQRRLYGGFGQARKGYTPGYAWAMSAPGRWQHVQFSVRLITPNETVS